MRSQATRTKAKARYLKQKEVVRIAIKLPHRRRYLLRSSTKRKAAILLQEGQLQSQAKRSKVLKWTVPHLQRQEAIPV